MSGGIAGAYGAPPARRANFLRLEFGIVPGKITCYVFM